MSKLTDYGTVVMTYLARAPSGVHAASEIALGTGVAGPTVSKLLKTLARAGLVSAQRGTRGGYSLVRAPSAISIAEIIDALEGPIGLTQCSSAPGQCEQEPSCSVRANWQRINGAVRAALDEVTLAHMLEPVAGRQVRIAPPARGRPSIGS